MLLREVALLEAKVKSEVSDTREACIMNLEAVIKKVQAYLKQASIAGAGTKLAKLSQKIDEVGKIVDELPEDGSCADCTKKIVALSKTAAQLTATTKFTDKLAKKNQTVVKSLAASISDWYGDNDGTAMPRMALRDSIDHLIICDYLQAGNLKKAEAYWGDMDTASREEIHDDVYEVFQGNDD